MRDIGSEEVKEDIKEQIVKNLGYLTLIELLDRGEVIQYITL